MKLGKKLRILRETNSLTMKQLSEILGISVNSIYRHEKGHSRPRGGTLKRIAEFYKVPIEYFGMLGADAELVTDAEKELLKAFRKLSTSGKYKAVGYIEHMAFTEEGGRALARTLQRSVAAANMRNAGTARINDHVDGKSYFAQEWRKYAKMFVPPKRRNNKDEIKVKWNITYLPMCKQLFA